VNIVLTIEKFRNQKLDNMPYTEGQIEFLMHVCNTIHWPWSCFEQDDVSITAQDSALGTSYVLKINDLCYMTTFPADILDHRSIYELAKGDVLLTGLGLGLGVLFACENPLVDSVTVIENNDVVMSKIAPLFVGECYSKVRFVNHDADTWLPDMHFDFAYIDHAYSRANSERYEPYSDMVVNWYDERVKLEQTWR